MVRKNGASANIQRWSLLLLVVFAYTPCRAAHEFVGYRMAQYDMQGVSYGSSASVVSNDLRTMRSPYLQFKCVVARSREMATSSFKSLRDAGTGCLLIILPSTWPHVTEVEKEEILEVEEELLADQWSMPVYFAIDSPKLTEIYSHADAVSAGNQPSSGASGSMAQLFGDVYHLVTPFKTEKQQQNFAVANIKGSLSGLGAEDSLPTIVLVAHYDSSGAAPSLSNGYDSNGSGVIALIELARIMSRFFSTSKTHPRYNIKFLLTGAGKYNYMGSKFWIDNLPETTHASPGVGQSGIQFVLCLDTLSLSSGGDIQQLLGHVSKPPKDDSPLDLFFKYLQQAVANQDTKNNRANSSMPNLVHKKINLGASRLAWEHERFSIRRLPAMTLSVLQSPNSKYRETISDLPPLSVSAYSDAVLCGNILAIGEALVHYIYDIPINPLSSTKNNETSDDFYLLGAPTVHPSCEHVRSLRQWFNNVQRAAPVMPTPPSSSRSQGATSFLGTLNSYISTWLPNSQIAVHSLDKKDPELVFYENYEVKLSAFVVKPAIYDLFVACGVGSYLGLFYLAVWKFPYIFSRFARFTLFLSPSVRSSSQGRLKGQ